jgi:hypothetical protein
MLKSNKLGQNTTLRMMGDGNPIGADYTYDRVIIRSIWQNCS